MESLRYALPQCTFHYPNRVAQVFFINAFWSFEMVWRIVRPLLHERAQRKVCIASPEETADCLRALILPDLLPREYGGMAPDYPPPSAARSLTDLCGRIPIKVWKDA